MVHAIKPVLEFVSSAPPLHIYTLIKHIIQGNSPGKLSYCSSRYFWSLMMNLFKLNFFFLPLLSIYSKRIFKYLYNIVYAILQEDSHMNSVLWWYTNLYLFFENFFVRNIVELIVIFLNVNVRINRIIKTSVFWICTKE